eukprot:882081-Prorocentrum_minimum.AAC.1
MENLLATGRGAHPQESVSHAFMHACIHAYIHSCIHLFVRSFIHSLVYSPMYPTMSRLTLKGALHVNTRPLIPRGCAHAWQPRAAAGRSKRSLRPLQPPVGG